MKMRKGLDISQYQGNPDFAKVKAAGYDFVIMRAGFGKSITQKDPVFETNYRNAKAAGLDVGVYWYSYAQSAEDAKKEAQVCLQAIAGKQFEYPIYFDMEEKSQMKSMAFCDSLIKAFCDEIEAGGYFAGLYSNLYTLNTYISEEVRRRYAVWLAQWTSKPSYTGPYGMWQKSAKGGVPGIKGDVDIDEGYIDYPTIIKAKGLNGFPKATTPEPQPTEHTVKLVIDGKTVYEGGI